MIVNGDLVDSFQSTQGVLFILMAEAFSRLITFKHDQQKQIGVKITATNLAVTHSLFANDTLLFGRSNI